MNKFTCYFLIGFACLLYILSAGTFLDYIYSLLIRDTVTAMDNAFGKLVLLIFMLVLAKRSLDSGKKRLKQLNNAINNDADD